MQNEKELQGDQVAKVSPNPPIQVQRGLSTSSGQFTAIFSIVALALSAVGYHYSPEQVENWVQMVNNFLITIGPLLAIIPVLLGYITSRGKITSNAINAQAAIANGPSSSVEGVSRGVLPLMGTATLMGTASGPNWKDPHTYEQLLHIAKAVGVPGAEKIDRYNQQLHPADLIDSIWGMFKHKQQ